jgi:integrase
MLTETQIRAARPREKPYKLYDERGLSMLVKPRGSPCWHFKYRFERREKLISLGTYPDVPLRRAREKRDEARRLVADGVDPSAKRKAEKAALADTFEAVTREYLEMKRRALAETTAEKRLSRFEAFLFPRLGKRPISKITPPEFLDALRRVERHGKNETAHRLRSESGQIFRYAIATGRADRDITADLRGALAPVIVRNHAAITDPVGIAQLLRAIDGYQGRQPLTEAALKLAPLVFVRPGELRAARWEEINLQAAEWRIPAARMKMRQQHIVPLSRQAVAILGDLAGVTGPDGFVFPGMRNSSRPMSNNAVTAALRRMGYTGEEMTWHGFRSLASTALNEQGFPPDVIELQLAHKERNEVRAAYNRAQRLEERRRMMQAWADYLDSLKGNCEFKRPQPIAYDPST